MCVLVKLCITILVLNNKFLCSWNRLQSYYHHPFVDLIISTDIIWQQNRFQQQTGPVFATRRFSTRDSPLLSQHPCTQPTTVSSSERKSFYANRRERASRWTKVWCEHVRTQNLCCEMLAPCLCRCAGVTQTSVCPGPHRVKERDSELSRRMKTMCNTSTPKRMH